MADENELELEESGGKKKKLIIIIAAVAILAIGGAAAFFFMSGDEPNQEEIEAALDSGEEGAGSADGAAESSAASVGTALYVPMPRPFRFNVPGASRDRFVEIRVQLMVRGADAEETAKKHIPLVESTLLQTFSQTNADDLATKAGKESLKQKSLQEVQAVFKEIEGNKLVEKVLFTGFVMQ